jgi:hypothetical protein
MVGLYPASGFAIVPIDNVMTSVFDAPVGAVGGKNTLGIGLVRDWAGDTIGKFS